MFMSQGPYSATRVSEFLRPFPACERYTCIAVVSSSLKVLQKAKDACSVLSVSLLLADGRFLEIDGVDMLQ